MTDLKSLQQWYAEFIGERDWEQFHTPQNAAMALSVEASELLECFLWHDNPPAEAVRDDPELVADVEEELADVLIYALGVAQRLDIDLLAAVSAKLDENERRFDEETAAEITDKLQSWQRPHDRPDGSSGTSE